MTAIILDNLVFRIYVKEIILEEIEEAIKSGDSEIEANFGPFSTYASKTDLEILNIYQFLHSFRG